jgi:hypothetical protein
VQWPARQFCLDGDQPARALVDLEDLRCVEGEPQIGVQGL